MSFSKPNRSDATMTRNRTPNSVSQSGFCTTCLDGCPGLCEMAKSAVRGRETLYPQPFGKVTAGSEKDYPVDWSHFQIMGTTTGAYGIEEDSDKALFRNVKLETKIGGIKLKLPIIIGAMGSTDVAKNNWEGLAAGAAISGIMLTVGENVCGMDTESKIENGKVIYSKDLEWRVKSFKEWYDGWGNIAVQANIEDTRLGVLEYAISKLDVDAVEIKWGQGAKDIGGEVKLRSLEKAKLLKSRGYLVYPDPDDPYVEKEFGKSILEFERHSRVGFANKEEFLERVDKLREQGAKYIFLKTGAYRPLDLAKAVRWSSDAKIDLLTVDGAGGGTGMSPWRMMNEWGIPTVYIEALLYDYLKRISGHRPSVAIAGGLSEEDHVFKALALGSPYVNVVEMARGPLGSVMVAKNIAKMIESGNVPVDLRKYGNDIESIFVAVPELKERFGEDWKKLPIGAIGLYSYLDRIATGLRQLMAGARKFSLDLLSRDDIASLTKEASEITGIQYIMDVDKEKVEEILKD